MDFRELVYITTVADCQSVTAAAKKLYISQPSLSQIISKVENELGVKLFDRTVYPIALTYAGETYVETARRILLLKDNLRRQLTDIGEGKRGRITLGIPVERAGYMLPATLKEFRKVYPGVEVCPVEANSSMLLEGLKRGDTNFVILPRESAEMASDTKAELEMEVIYKEELLLVTGEGVLSPEHMVKGREDTVDIAKLENVPFILLKKGHSIRRHADRLFRKNHISPEIVVETSSNINAVQLANAGLGAAIVPERAVAILGGREKIRCYTLGYQASTWDVNVIYLKDAYLDGAERFFIEVMKKIFSI